LFLTVGGIPCGLYDRGYVLGYPAEIKEIALIQCVQNRSKINQSSYTELAGDCISRNEVAQT